MHFFIEHKPESKDIEVHSFEKKTVHLSSLPIPTTKFLFWINLSC